MDDVAFEFPCGGDIYKGAVVKLIWYRLMSIGRQPYTAQGGGVEGGGSGSARADFNLRELPCYLSYTYDTLPLLLKFIVE